MNPEFYLFIYLIVGALTYISVKKFIIGHSQLVFFATFFYSILFWPLIIITYPVLYIQHKKDERTRNNIRNVLKGN